MQSLSPQLLLSALLIVALTVLKEVRLAILLQLVFPIESLRLTYDFCNTDLATLCNSDFDMELQRLQEQIFTNSGDISAK